MGNTHGHGKLEEAVLYSLLCNSEGQVSEILRVGISS